MAIGRDTKLTPDVQKSICDLLRIGNTRRTAAEASGITERTLYYWLEQAKEAEAASDETNEFFQFFQSLTRAEAECQARNVAVVQKAAAGYKTLTTRTKTKKYEEFVMGSDGNPMRDKRGRPIKREVVESDTVITEGFEFAYQAALELLKRRFRTEWGDSLDIRKWDDETLLRALELTKGAETP